MASSSSASNSHSSPRKYDVFLSFRGEDTRNNFTSHLYEALIKRGIHTFLDDKRLQHGDSIPEELVKAIKDSQVAVIIFSKNYATSRWCLNELVEIMECKKDKNVQRVIPVFYNVDPSHVRNQRKTFAEAFAEHESNYKDDVEGMQKVQGWRTALTEAANLKGCDTSDKIESECIRDLVDQISSKLCKASLSYLQNIVRIDTHLKEVNSLLEMEINDVRIIGIWGMGGVGKTTIATAIFHTLSDQFEAACFLEDVKEIAKTKQLFSLQNILLSKLLGKKDDYVNNKHEGKWMIPSRLRLMKVLIVLDDIDQLDQLEYLAGDVGWFGNGSRVVITTRDKRLIEKNDAIIYELTPLPDLEAMQLFNKHAFKGKIPDECFKNLSLEVLNYAKGLPLALKVWGSMLHNRVIDEWTSAIEEIRNNSDSNIAENLKISYDGLKAEEQMIFLDIACFFRGDDKKGTMKILESCYSGVEYKLSVLIEKSLLFISGDYDSIQMHDLIQDMGKYVVKMQKDPGERSRLWDVVDFEEVMSNNTGTKAVEAIWFEYKEKLCFSKEAMKNMTMLRMLYVWYTRSNDCFLCNDGSIEYLPNSLRWFVWNCFPWESLPENFEPRKLVRLDLHNSSLCHLWKGTKHLPFLRKLDLSLSKRLMRTPDFTGMPNLEYLNMWGCRSLEEVDESLGYCGKLIKLDLSNCYSLKRFPCVNVETLKFLNLRDCPSLEKFPEIRGRMKLELKIEMKESGIRDLTSSFFQSITHLTKLDLSFMKHLVALPRSIGMLKSLVELDVSDFSSLEILPEEIGDLENLEKLDASSTLISCPRSSIVRLNKLKFLSFEKKESEVGVCFVFPSVAKGLRSLEILNLNNCNLIDGGLPEDRGSLSSLKELNLSGNNFEHLPRSIAQLGALRLLELSDCKELEELPGFMGMTNLEYLKLGNCDDLEEVDDSLGYCGKLIQLYLGCCSSLKRFPSVNVESLEFLNLIYCFSLKKFPEIRGRMKPELKIEMKDSGIRELPSSFFQYQTHLTKLDLSFMKQLVALPRSISMLKNLVELDVSNFSSLKILPEEIGDLENLEKLDAHRTLISRPPSSIVRLNKLKLLNFKKQKLLVGLEYRVNFVFPQVNEGLHSLEYLDLSYCNLIDGGLPEDIGSLSSLKKLNLNGNNFEHLPLSIAQLAALRSLYLLDCAKLTQLPEFPQQLDTIYADWSNDGICNSLFQNISSLQHDISASDSLSLRVFTSGEKKRVFTSWFHHWGIDRSVSVNLPENWYVPNNFLGFVVCYSSRLIETTAQLFPLCDDGVSSMTQKLTLPNHSEFGVTEPPIQFFLVPLVGLWDTSKANGKTPNDYGLIRLSFSGERMYFGLRLLYKDEPELDALLEPTYHGVMTRRSRYVTP